jgi:SAM-dependent methyltransferase
MTSDDERFVRAFHDRHPGATSAAFARGRAIPDDPDDAANAGRSSYALVAEHASPGARVLDLGCGDGVLLALAAARGACAIGVDLSAGELARARAHAPCAQGRAEALPFADGAFDVCLSHLAFSILPDPEAAAREVARVVAPGGVFAIVTGGAPAEGADDAFALLFELARPALAARAAAPRLGDRRARHAAGLDALLGSAGFAPCAWRGYTIDLGGGADVVWNTLATLYELAPLDDAARAALGRAFRETAGPGPVRCAIRIGVAASRRRSV